MKHDLPQIIIIDMAATRNVDTTVAHGNVSLYVIIYGGLPRWPTLKTGIQISVRVYTRRKR
jgi:hypothetical protein